MLPQETVNLVCVPQVVEDLPILGLSHCCELDCEDSLSACIAKSNDHIWPLTLLAAQLA